MAQYVWGDGYPYTDLANALAAPSTTMTEDYVFTGQLNTGSSKLYEHTSNVSIPAFGTSSAAYSVTIEGAVGSIDDLTSQIELSFSDSATSGLYCGGMTEQGLIIKNLKLSSSVGYAISTHNNPHTNVVDVYAITTANNYRGLLCRLVPNIKNCILVGSGENGSGMYIQSGNGCIIADSLLRGTTYGLFAPSRYFVKIIGCSIYGGANGISVSNAYYWQIMKSLVMGGTAYAIDGTQSAAAAQTMLLYRSLFYSGGYTNSINSEGNIDAMLKDYSYNNVDSILIDPKLGLTGNDKEFFEPDENTSPIVIANQTPIYNGIWESQYRDLFSYGAWTNHTQQASSSTRMSIFGNGILKG